MTTEKKIIVKQEFLPTSWATEFLRAHEAFVQKVRKGEVEAPTLSVDYGTDGANPYGVGSSSLTRDVRQWWYARKKRERAATPPEYSFTAEQGRMMEQPVLLALAEMGVKFSGQVATRTVNHGGFVDGIGEVNGESILFESKHIGASRYLDMWYKPLTEASADYFWQAQSYLEGTDAAYSLFVVTAQDSSAVKKMLTDDKRFNAKRGFWYDHTREPNPKVFAFKLFKAPVAEAMDKRAIEMVKTLQVNKAPARELDIYKDWHCQPNFCGYRDICLTDGAEGGKIFQLPEVEIKVVYL